MELRYKHRTMEGYRRYLTPFVTWLLVLNVVPEEAYEWDDMLVELRHGSDDAPPYTKAGYEKCISALEFVLPHLKGRLLLAHAELNAWRVSTKPRHAVPLILPFCFCNAS